jgi:hypothetical protein
LEEEMKMFRRVVLVTVRAVAAVVATGVGLLTTGMLLWLSGVVLNEMLGASQPVPYLLCLGVVAVMVDTEIRGVGYLWRHLLDH